jgi:hypothetical protein
MVENDVSVIQTIDFAILAYDITDTESYEYV